MTVDTAPATSPAASRLRHALAHAAVPLLFAALCLFGILAARIGPEFLLREMLVRFQTSPKHPLKELNRAYRKF